ncbi:iron response transcriptional regulator IrrA [Bosea sp. (in: a-proteobacteria)]|jgi:Fur family iron response transcriptional regulator|uniref:Ferric uptake regulation protein n=1 Tax=Bosea vestrisii TaxID=151416 RepID=A0ABW0HFC1_9HYPH|nr:Fur family transcriptional regulator [Bosea sp. (in: a-proteobacteria)]MBA4224808.1 transcriptional repressor [Methylobacterium sp.]
MESTRGMDGQTQEQGYGADARQGCPFHDVRQKLRRVGLRPTRQRVSLGWLLFAKGDRHISAEMLYEEAMKARVPVSLATVYNTLHQFTQAGLLRELAIDGAKTFFDTDNSDHHHFVVDGEDKVIDIPASAVDVAELPPPPDGYEISRVDVVVRLRKVGG